ncbi:MAG: hypothetical protein WCO00_16420 [Rhodospirillaceae bacterium]
MALTAIGLCNRALVKLGAAPIGGFEDGTAEAETAGALYEATRDGLLSAHPWSFARRQATLARLTEVPVADYAYGFALPADFLAALSAGGSGAGRGLVNRIAGQSLQADSEAVILTYLGRVDEAGFPPVFAAALAARLAAEFCLPLTESTARASALHQLADQEFRRARLIDGQQDTRTGFDRYSLIEARN